MCDVEASGGLLPSPRGQTPHQRRAACHDPDDDRGTERVDLADADDPRAVGPLPLRPQPVGLAYGSIIFCVICHSGSPHSVQEAP